MPGTTICSTTLASCSGGLPTAISEPSIVTRKRIFLSPPFSHFPSGFSTTSSTMTADEVAVKELVAPIHPPSESLNSRKLRASGVRGSRKLVSASHPCDNLIGGRYVPPHLLLSFSLMLRWGVWGEECAGMNLDETAVGRLLHMQEVIPQMERALADFSSGRVVQPTRVMLPVAEHQGFLGLMPAYTGTALGTKLVAFYPHNADVPTHHATILLFKPETGEPLAAMDGRLITEIRTAAVSAVATQRLAKPDASVLGIIGSGGPAGRHPEALRPGGGL